MLILLVGLSVLAAGIFSARILKNSYIDALEQNLVREIAIILATDNWAKEGSLDEMTAYYGTRVKSLKDSAGARLTYIRADGKVLADSESNPEEMDNHLSREEVREAAESGIGYSVRHSNTLGQDMLYAAEPIKNGNNEIIAYIRLAMSLESVDESLNKLWMYMLIGLFVLFAVAGLVSYRIAFSITRPLEKITRVAQRITNLDYGSRVSVMRKDEIGQLGQAINTMADSLQNQLQRISEHKTRLQNVLMNMTSGILLVSKEKKIVIVNPVAEEYLGYSSDELVDKVYMEAGLPHEMAQEIEMCEETGSPVHDEFVLHFPNERIVELNITPLYESDGSGSGSLIVLHDITAFRRLERMRSEFVANVSHELKTPIAAVKGFSETLLAGALDDPETARSFIQIIFDESERLNRLIGDILELSKIESRRTNTTDFSPVELRSFMEESLRTVQGEADRKRIRLSLEAESDIYMEADEDKLRQIMINLLSNGVNYTPEGGEVRVKVEVLDEPEEIADDNGEEGNDKLVPAYGDGKRERIRITVSDSGIGIPRKDLPRIFERFYRVDKARSRSSGGTGLGLSIVKHLVEPHHGTITVDSQVGVGSSFIIELNVLQEGL